MNKQNKKNSCKQDKPWKPANDTRDQELNYANNIKWNTNHN